MLNQITTNKSKVCFGITNKALKNTYLPFFDYDDITKYNEIKQELLRLQTYYSLSDIFIFSSKNGYNAFSLDKLPYFMFKKIFNESIYVCKDYRELGLKRKILTLRIGKDKILKEILFRHTTAWEKSFPHLLALNRFYRVSLKYDKKEFDNNLDLLLKAYRSRKHGFIKVGEL